MNYIIAVVLTPLFVWAGNVAFTGESYPPPKLSEQAVYYVRAPSAITP